MPPDVEGVTMGSWRTLLRNNLRRKRLWGALLGTIFLGGLSVYVLYSLLGSDITEPNLMQLLEKLGPATFAYATLVGSLVYIPTLALAIVGWGTIMGNLSHFQHWPQHFRIYAITTITRRIPGTIWYMLGRIVMYERFQIKRSVTAIASGVEFAAILLGAILITLITWPLVLSGHEINPLWLVLGLCIGVLLLNPPVLQTAIQRLSRQSEPINLRYHHLLTWVLIYAGVWIGGGLVLFMLATSIHPLAWTTLPPLIGIWATVGLVGAVFAFIPFSLGVQELTLTALMSPYTGTAEALIIALLMRAVLTLNEVCWALIAGLLGLTGLIRTPVDERSVIVDSQEEESLSDTKKPQEVSQTVPLLPPK